MIILLLSTWIYLLSFLSSTTLPLTCTLPTNCEYSYDVNSPLQCSCDPSCTRVGKRLLCTYSGQIKSNCSSSCSPTSLVSACGKLCCYRNCAPEQWQNWSECQGPCGNKTGSRTRTRIVLPQNKSLCGGLPCPALSQTEMCLTNCCKVDCQWTAWSVWGPCNNTCGNGYQFSTRSHLEEASCGGLDCEGNSIQSQPCSSNLNVDCIMDSWSSWSTCELLNNQCGKGFQHRTRSIIRPQACQGQPCETNIESKVCEGPCCETNCSMSNWSSWSFCNVSCGDGYRSRSRIIQQEGSCGGSSCTESLLEIENCIKNETLNCTFSDWSDWSPCSTLCGTGIQTRERVILTDTSCGGSCDDYLSMNQTCVSYDANINCSVSEWTSWSTCFRNCKGGEQTRTRSIIQNSQCNGTICPSLKDTQKCQPICSQNCDAGICICKPGYAINPDGFTCDKLFCHSTPNVIYAPTGLTFGVQYSYVQYQCPSIIAAGDICPASCQNKDWVLRGDVQDYTCQDSGDFNYQKMYCGPSNLYPTNVDLDVTTILEESTTYPCFGTFTTTDPNEIFSTHEYSLLANFENRLIIKNNMLCLNYVPNYEAPNNVWKIYVRTTDKGGLIFDRLFNITLLDTNDPPSACSIDTNGTIPENVGMNYFVGNLVFEDEDEDQRNINTYIIDTDSDNFEIYYNYTTKLFAVRVKTVASTACLERGGISCNLNFEVQNSLRISIEADETGNPDVTSYFDMFITLLDQNDAPTLVYLNNTEIPENLPPGYNFATFNIDDEDNGTQTYQYVLIKGNPDYFRIDGGTNLILLKPLNFEDTGTPNLNIVVQGIDSGSPPMNVSSHIFLTVGDVNEAPEVTLISPGQVLNNTYQINVPENLERNSKIASVYLSDPDIGENLSYIIEGGDYLDLVNNGCGTQNVQIRHTDCQFDLISRVSFNYEIESSFEFNITIKDLSNLTVIAKFSINVTDRNEIPTEIIFTATNSSSVEVNENEVGLDISMLSTVDEDEANQNEFGIVEDASGLFEILPNGMFKLKDGKSLNFEDPSKEHKVTVYVNNFGNPQQFLSMDLIITTKNVNEPPVRLNFNSTNTVNITSTDVNGTQIQMNYPHMMFTGVNPQENDVIGQMTFYDPDDNETLEVNCNYSFVNCRMTECKPQIFSGTVCKVVISIGNINGMKNETSGYIPVLISVVDQSNLTFQQMVVLYIPNLTEGTMTLFSNNVNLDSIQINENSDNVFIGNLSIEGGMVDKEYTFDVEDDFSNCFIINNGSELSTKFNCSFDFETVTQFYITIAAVQESGAKIYKTFPILVMDVNEAPTAISLTNSKISEDVGPMFPLTKVLTDDPDNPRGNQSFTYNLLTFASVFTIQNGELMLLPGQQLDYELISTYPISIEVTDSGLPHMTASFDVRLDIGDVNEAPENFEITSNTILENSEIGTVIGTLSAEDPDRGTILAYRLSSNDTEFIIENNLLIVGKIFDFEVAEKYTVNISVCDNGSPVREISKVFDILIGNVNEKPHIIIKNLHGTDSHNISIQENNSNDTIIGIIYITDPDINDTVKCSIETPADGFCIHTLSESADNISYALMSHMSFDFENLTELFLSIHAKDSGNLTDSATTIVQVTNVNEAPTNIRIDGLNSSVVNLKENVIGKQIILSLTVDDPDFGDRHTFWIDKCLNCEGKFEFPNNGSRLYLADGQFFNYEKVMNESIEIFVTAVDSGNLSISLTIFVVIVNVNDPPSMPTLDINHIPRYFTSEYVFGTVMVLDEDVDSDINDIECKIKGPVDWLHIENIQNVHILQSIEERYLNKTFVNFLILCTDKNFPQSTTKSDVTLEIVDIGNEPMHIIFKEVASQVFENQSNVTLGRLGFQTSFSKRIINYASSSLIHNWPSTLDIKVKDDGEIVIGSPVNFEDISSFEIAFLLENRSLSERIEARITVVDVNEAPKSVSFQGGPIVTLDQNGIGVEIGTIVATDEDLNQNHKFEISNITCIYSNSSQLSVLDPSVLVLNIDKLLTNAFFIGMSELFVTINCTDDGSPSLSTEYMLQVNISINSPPEQIIFDATTFSFLENTTINSTVSTFSVIDVDGNDNHSCNSSNSNFKVYNSSILLAEALNYETGNSSETTITCVDKGGLAVSSQLVITIENIDEPPANGIISSEKWKEDEVYLTMVGIISASDPEGTECRFELINCEKIFCPFFVAENGYVFLNQSLAKVTSSDDLFFNINVSDGTLMTTSFRINVTIIRKTLPTISLSTTNIINVPENSQLGTKLFDITVTLLQGEMVPIYCEASTVGDFVAVQGFEAVLHNFLDFEISKYLIVNITCSKNRFQMLEMVEVTLNVTDVDEPISEIVLNITNSIKEGSYVNKLLGNILIKDPEMNIQNVKCYSDNANMSFVPTREITDLQALSYAVVITTEFDYEKDEYGFNFTITCKDYVSSVVKDASLTIDDANDRPSDLIIQGSTIIDLDFVKEYDTIATLEVVDQDKMQSYNIKVQGPGDKYFFITEKQELKVKNIEFCWTGPFNCSFLVIDNGIPPLEAVFTNEFTFIKSKGEIILSNYDIDIDSAANTTIGSIQYLRNSTFPDVFFKLENVPNKAFTVNGSDLILLICANEFQFAKINFKIVVYDAISNESIADVNIRLQISGNSICHSSLNNCNENSTCKLTEDHLGFHCDCKRGFVKKHNHCIEVNECDRMPCYGAKSHCLNLINDFRCLCEPGRKGRNCEIVEITNCGDLPCANGICMNRVCICLTGWQGASCDVSVNDCAINSCHGNGICEDRHQGFLCHCRREFSGLFCEQNASLCSHCSNNGCVALNNNTDSICIGPENSISIKFSVSDLTMMDTKYFEVLFLRFLKLIPQFSGGLTFVRVKVLHGRSRQLIVASFDQSGQIILTDTSWSTMRTSCYNMQLTLESVACSQVFGSGMVTSTPSSSTVKGTVCYSLLVIGCMFGLINL